MSPHGDIHVEPERIAASGGDFILRAGEPGVCQRREAARSYASLKFRRDEQPLIPNPPVEEPSLELCLS